MQDILIIPFVYISDDGIQIKIRAAVLEESHEFRFKAIFSGGGPDHVQRPSAGGGSIVRVCHVFLSCLYENII